jgi:DNA-binding MarR family transcriptional regulator
MPDAKSSIQDEIRQSRPFGSVTQEAAVAILRSANDLRRALGDVVGVAGLSLQQYNVLRILRGARGEPLPTLEIAERMVERTPGVTRLLDGLEKRGLVERVRCTEDRRRVLCSITDTGLELMAPLDQGIDEREKAGLGALGEARLSELVKLLDEVRAGLRSTSGLADPES